GTARKSTALWLAHQLLERVDVDFKNLSGVASTEAIYEALAARDGTKGLIYADEFRTLLAVGKRQGTANLLPELNTLYTCPTRKEINRRKESTTIVEPFLSLISATPRAYVDDLLSDIDIRG